MAAEAPRVALGYNRPPMPVKAGYSTPLLHVADVRRSIAFYQLLGFELIDDDGCVPPGWARIHCTGGALMFLGAEEGSPPPRPVHDRFMLTMYTPDLPALRAQLVAAGIECSEIKRPPYMPGGELYLSDPDGYRIQLCHWSQVEDERWERHLEERKRKATS